MQSSIAIVIVSVNVDVETYCIDGYFIRQSNTSTQTHIHTYILKQVQVRQQILKIQLEKIHERTNFTFLSQVVHFHLPLQPPVY